MTAVGPSKSPSTFGSGQTVDKPHKMSGKQISLQGPKEQSDYQRTSCGGKGTKILLTLAPTLMQNIFAPIIFEIFSGGYFSF